MKFQFDSSQAYQLDAVQAIVTLFEGQPLAKGSFEIAFTQPLGMEFTDTGIGNRLVLSEEQLLHNIQSVQKRNGIMPSEKLEPCLYEAEEGREGEIPFNFTVEMETGTGKTYTYLRTIYELNKVYGFKKFVIVVPSIAIREGVLKNLEVTREHFQSLYDNPPMDFFLYDSGKLASLRSFATANTLQVMIINIRPLAKVIWVASNPSCRDSPVSSSAARSASFYFYTSLPGF